MSVLYIIKLCFHIYLCTLSLASCDKFLVQELSITGAAYTHVMALLHFYTFGQVAVVTEFSVLCKPYIPWQLTIYTIAAYGLS